MTLPVQLRRPTVEDAPALAHLLAELGYAVPEDVVRANVLHLSDGPTDKAWVADDGTSVLGLVSVHLTPLFHASGYLGRITSLVVHRQARGKGVGSMLVQQAERFCWGVGCERIELTSGDHRDQAHHFHERLGFRVHSRRFIKQRSI